MWLKTKTDAFMVLRERGTGVTMTPNHSPSVQGKPTGVTDAKLALYATTEPNSTMPKYCENCNTLLKTFPVCKDGETVGFELACPNAGYCGQHTS